MAVTFFLKRIFDLLRENGRFAVISTHSVYQGNSREAGVGAILKSGGVISYAERSRVWPGRANVRVCLFAISKGPVQEQPLLDGRSASRISSYFLEESVEESANPSSLEENSKRCFVGVTPNGSGFLLSNSEKEDLIRECPEATGKIWPYISRIVDDPVLIIDRYVIDLFGHSLDEVAKMSAVYNRLYSTVYPTRKDNKKKQYREKWWCFQESSPGLYSAIRSQTLNQLFAVTKTTKHFAFVLLPSSARHDQNLSLIASVSWAGFSVLSSTLHDAWVRKFAAALGQTPRYNPASAFMTFPFPVHVWENYPNPDLAAIGERYHEHRRDLMLRLWLGLTDIYNLFHAPDLDARLDKLFHKRAKTGDWHRAENVPPEHRSTAGSLTQPQARDAIHHLRDLHRQLDQAVLTAYAWHEQGPDGPAIVLGHDFHEVETLPENDRTRYTITPQARKDLLTRLLKLNHQRAAEEQNATAVQAKTSFTRKTAKQSVIQLPPDDLDLFRSSSK